MALLVALSLTAMAGGGGPSPETPALLVKVGPHLTDTQKLFVHESRDSSGIGDIRVIVANTTYTLAQVGPNDWEATVEGLPLAAEDVVVIKNSETFTGYSYALTGTAGSLTFRKGWLQEERPVAVTWNPATTVHAVDDNLWIPVTARHSTLLGIANLRSETSFGVWVDNTDTAQDHYYDFHKVEGGFGWIGTDVADLYGWAELSNIWLEVLDNPRGVETLRPTGPNTCNTTWSHNERVALYGEELVNPLLYLNKPATGNYAKFGVEISGEWFNGWQPISATVKYATEAPGVVITQTVDVDFTGQKMLFVEMAWKNTDNTGHPIYWEVVFELLYANPTQHRQVRPLIGGGKTQCNFNGAHSLLTYESNAPQNMPLTPQATYAFTITARPVATEELILAPGYFEVVTASTPYTSTGVSPNVTFGQVTETTTVTLGMRYVHYAPGVSPSTATWLLDENGRLTVQAGLIWPVLPLRTYYIPFMISSGMIGTVKGD